MLPVNEIFVTIQGEANFTGTPATFIRLQGCPVGCGFCDTKHTWYREPEDKISIELMLEKQTDSPKYGMMSEQDILQVLEDLNAPVHVVITGGEPALYDLTGLTTKLLSQGYQPQLETSGHFLPNVHKHTFITCSPKMGMPGGDAKPEFVQMANEIKWPVGKQRDIDNIDAMLGQLETTPDVWLQPLSQSNKATKLCVDTAIARDWNVSIQTHKFMGVR